eukprot:5952951-Alexandrium_andersonii.AAC.1
MMCSSLDEGPLRTVFHHFAPADGDFALRSGMIQDARHYGFSMLAQLWFRFLSLATWPYKFVAFVLPRVTAEA